VGELPDPERAGGIALRDGDAIAIAGPFAPSLAGSELAKLRGDLDAGLPETPATAVQIAITFVRDAVRAGRVTAAHDVSDGGIACALAEMAIASGVGARVDLDELVELRGASGESCLFGEGPGGFLVAGERSEVEALARDAAVLNVDMLMIGKAIGDRLELSAAETEIGLPLDDAAAAWRSLGERMGGGVLT